jgi:hypothetical protein
LPSLSNAAGFPVGMAPRQWSEPAPINAPDIRENRQKNEINQG